MENKLFCDYFDEWIEVYKVGAVRDVTVQKYRKSSKWLRKLAPEMKCKEVTRQQYQGVSIASVSKRLGHANMTTTQNVYLHIVQELESKDTDLVMRAMSTL